MIEKIFTGTGDELEPAPEALEEEQSGERIEPGEVVPDPDFEPEKIEEIISRAIQAALRPLRESIDELVTNRPTPDSFRYRIEERPFQNHPFSVIRRRGWKDEELGTFGYQNDAEHFIEFLKRGGWGDDDS